MLQIDSPKVNDNRAYDYSAAAPYVRAEFAAIADWIPAGARVIDLGCGNGSLLKFLRDQKPIVGTGIDVSPSGVAACQALGFTAQVGTIDNLNTYTLFPDAYFDYAICNVTLQMVLYPEVLLSAMRRIARHQIISFPNFAFWRNRLDLVLHGRMPQPLLYGYSWYATGHIHQLSIRDFNEVCAVVGLRVSGQKHIGNWGRVARLCLPNLFSKVSVFLCEPCERRF